jgi:hypothetical protein
LVVLTHGGGTGKRETEVEEQLTEILDVLAGIAASHSLGFRWRERCGALDASMCINFRAAVSPSIITTPVIEQGSPRMSMLLQEAST